MTTIKMRHAISKAGNKLILSSLIAALIIVAMFFGSIISDAHRDAKAIIDLQVSTELERIPFDVNRMSVGLDKVSQAMSQSKNIDVAVLVEKNGRLISGNPFRSPRFMMTNDFKNFDLPSGEVVRVTTSINYIGAVKNAFVIIGILSIVFVSLLRAYQAYLKRLVSRLTQPLSQLTNQVLKISKNLPQSARTEINVDTSEIEECKTLADAANELLKEIDSKVEELKLVSKSEAKIEIASMLVHDMKTPLGTLKAGIELSEGMEDSIRKSLLDIVDDLNGLVTELRGIRAVEENEIEKSRLGISRCDLNDEVEKFLNKKSVLFEAKSIHVNFHSSTSLSFIEVNPSDFQRVLSNLVENAMSAEATQIDISSTPLDGVCRLSIADNGKGISEERIPTIFDKGVSHRGSSGLGLSFVKEKIEAWDGYVSVNSKEGHGTSFDIILNLSSVRDKTNQPRLGLTAESKEEVQHG